MPHPDIAFLGTGLMGAPMVRNLLRAGYPVTVWNRSSEKALGLVPDGARLAFVERAPRLEKRGAFWGLPEAGEGRLWVIDTVGGITSRPFEAVRISGRG